MQNCRHFRKRLFQAGFAQEVREAKKQGRTCVIWSVNGPPCPGHMIEAEEELSWVQTWYNLGVRLMHLTYNRRNIVGDGCAEPANGGLSHFGRDLVKKMNEVGIIVDTSHSGKQTTLDAAHLSERPMVASHTACEAVFEHIRCKSDEELKAIADTGGLMGVYVLPNMLGPDATLATVLDHLEHAAKVIGVDHISIGTDTTYSSSWPTGIKGFPDARFNSQWWGAWDPEVQARYRTDEARSGSLAWTNWPLYTVGLVTRGYSDEDIEKIVGGNLLRVLEANEA